MISRYSRNPILTADQWSYPINSVFNAGAALVNNHTLLLCRCEDFEGRSHFCNAISADGISDWHIDTKPCLSGQGKWECFGIEDPRITWLSEKACYAVAYTSCGEYGPGVSIALTTDFQTWECLGQVFFAENKDAVLLPERIGSQWAMIHRPVIAHGHNASIWISYSKDLLHWGDHECIMGGRGGTYWDAHKIGISLPLMQTEQGWLMMYHSGKGTPGGCLYRCGLALLDMDDPAKVLCRGKEWVFGPMEDYERQGDVDNVVFPCGWTQYGNDVHIYYGAADSSVCLAMAKVDEMLDWVLSNS